MNKNLSKQYLYKITEFFYITLIGKGRKKHKISIIIHDQADSNDYISKILLFLCKWGWMVFLYALSY